MTLAGARWNVVPDGDADTVRALATDLNVPPTLAKILVQRGHSSPEDAKRFLRPPLEELSDPFLLVNYSTAPST